MCLVKWSAEDMLNISLLLLKIMFTDWVRRKRIFPNYKYNVYKERCLMVSFDKNYFSISTAIFVGKVKKSYINFSDLFIKCSDFLKVQLGNRCSPLTHSVSYHHLNVTGERVPDYPRHVHQRRRCHRLLLRVAQESQPRQLRQVATIIVGNSTCEMQRLLRICWTRNMEFGDKDHLVKIHLVATLP